MDDVTAQLVKALGSSGYEQFEAVARTRSGAVFRAVAPSDGRAVRSVILKIYTDESDGPDRETAVLRRLRRTFQLLTLGGTRCLETPDIGGVSVGSVCARRRLTIDEALAIGAAVAGELSEVHRRHVIHKDVNPSNVVWNERTGAVQLIDFGVASELALEQAELAPPSQIEGTLAYMAPEQTGRMNRPLDARADLYALGVTLYEMLTGRRPFETSDPLDLVYCHLARAAAPPREVDPRIPEVVSDIVLRLMAKEPQDRYQTAWGVEADLCWCVESWRRARRIEPFPLGRRDVPDRLAIPRRLYGRDEEIEAVTLALERSAEGCAELVLVGGPPGIGKSALAHELLRSLTGKRGMFATGKCDRLQRATPYDVLARALQDVVRHLLGAEPDAVASWRQALLSALGENGALVAALVPELSLLIGPQPPVRELDPVAARNRSTLVLRGFVRALCRDSQPLVLFLDDLQWADAATLDLLCELAADPDLRFCCMILAYRDNDLSEGHPLRAAMERIHNGAARGTSLALSPLPERAVVELIADALRVPAPRAASLARIVERKTGGNPFVIGQLLQRLHLDGVITFDPASGSFTWDEARAEAAPMAENAAELLRTRLGELSPAAREALCVGACLGDTFDIGTLAALRRAAMEDTLSDLREPVEAGMLIPLRLRAPAGHSSGATFAFAHDRIREAAYALIEERDRPAVHLDLGQRLLATTPAERLDERLFVILDQLKAGQALLTDEGERIEVARLFLRGGQRALGAASFEAAASLLGAGARVLGEQGFARARELAVSLYRAAGLSACLVGDFDGVERLASVLSSHATSVLDEVQADGLRIRSAQAQDRNMDALRLGFRALERLGLTFPDKPTAEDVQRAITVIRERLSGREVEELAALPPMRDPRILLALEIASQIMALVFQYAPERHPFLVTQLVRLSIDHGTAPSTPLWYAYFAALLDLHGDVEGAGRFGRLVMQVMPRLGSRELLAKITILIEGVVHARTAHFRDTLEPLRLGYQEGVAYGDFEWAAYCGFAYCMYAYLAGAPLRGLSHEIIGMARAFYKLHQEPTAREAAALEQATMNLLGEGGQPTVLQGEAYDERTMRPIMEANGEHMSLFVVAMVRILLLCLFGDFRGVLEELERAEPWLLAGRGLPVHYPRLQVAVALSCLMLAADEVGDGRAALILRAEAILDEVRAATRSGAANLRHHVALLDAIGSALRSDDPWATARLYDEAVAGAEAEGYVQDAAFACELAGRFWLASGKAFLARAYLERARRLYARWGAVAKVAQLEQQYASLLPMHAPMGALLTTSQAPAVLLDAASLFKALHAITSSLTLHELPTRLLSTVMENAGAQRGALFVEREGALVLEAAGDPSRGAVRAGGVPVERAGDRACLSAVRTVARTRAPMVLEDARTSPATRDDPYVVSRQTRSMLCAPVLSGGALRGVLYIENDLATGAFTAERVEVVGVLSAQAAVALENAFLYDDLERLLQERTRLLALAEEGVRARDTFLTLAAHELRTPLTPLLMEVQVLLRDARAGGTRAGGPERAATKLERAVRQIARLERLANDLLDVARLSAGQPEMQMEPVDLSQVVRDVAASHAVALEHAGSTLSVAAEPGVVGVWDRARLRQVVDKLLSNAVKFGEGKPIDVRAEGDGDWARLVVRDRGAGIPRATQARLFGRFERGVSERHFGGLGLGLWIVRRVVDALGGNIRIESEPGAGATFIVELPREPVRESSRPSPNARTNRQAPSGALHSRAGGTG
ncbi:ATP-binding sensor histidine kinase [Sorangium sp. So ce1504]|uniref:GAF domain-containing sensor histidine kinase n=1 Tax=Sorangium sp. So ce1504 TaxID=3133337 RepID=UPI003F610F5C